MKKLLFSLAVVGLLALALCATASAKSPTLTSRATVVASTGVFGPVWTARADQISPSVSAVDPAAAPNDIDTPVTITGADFAAVMDESGTVVVTAPTASLGGTALTDVTFVDSTTLTATVPWGMDPGVYDLTVVNPDGGTGSLPGAFTVTQGLGKWNGGDLFGGEAQQILMKPGDPDTLYAPAYGIVGLFRSRDAGENWTHVGTDVFISNGKFAIDPLHPSWLWGYTFDGLHRSLDEGDTWTTVMGNTWPDGRPIDHGQVYLSRYDPHTLFLSSYEEPLEGYAPGDAVGLLKSIDGGASWQIVADLEGVQVEDVAFHPTDPLQMVLVTRDARIFASGDGGDTWIEVAKPAVSSIGFRSVIAYNPYVTGEVWIASTSPNAIFKSENAALSGWRNVTQLDGQGGSALTFTGPNSVYTTGHHSADGGSSWDRFGPLTSGGELIFDPSHPQIGYLGDNTFGVQKTTDGGQTWEVKDQGLTGMICDSLDVSRADPLRVFATFGDSAGVYRSDDGASTWTYLPIPDSIHVGQVREDPTDPQRVYAISHSAFYAATGVGETWSDLGWNVSPASPSEVLWVMEPNPFQPGHLLVGRDTGPYLTGPGYLYGSSDFGVSWHAVTMPQELARITDIAFDPVTPGLVYLTTAGTGIYRSTDSGASWERIDDPGQPKMQSAETITFATQPRPTLLVGTGSEPYRSLDGGSTWERAQSQPGGVRDYLFVGRDSTRLYAATFRGLFLSSNGGDTWTRAAGAFGRLQILALGSAAATDHAILYAATSGGAAGATSSTAARSPRTARTAASTVVDAGIYRYVLLPAPKLTLRLSGLTSGALKLGRYLTASGKVTPGRFAGSKVKLTVQRKGRKWVTVKTVTRPSSVKGTYSWKYKLAKRGSYRLQATIAKTTKTAAAATTWRTFRVK
jgi:photosystem II stability/assembly factor-like uncharacterized protein